MGWQFQENFRERACRSCSVLYGSSEHKARHARDPFILATRRGRVRVRRETTLVRAETNPAAAVLERRGRRAGRPDRAEVERAERLQSPPPVAWARQEPVAKQARAAKRAPARAATVRARPMAAPLAHAMRARSSATAATTYAVQSVRSTRVCKLAAVAASLAAPRRTQLRPVMARAVVLRASRDIPERTVNIRGCKPHRSRPTTPAHTLGE